MAKAKVLRNLRAISRIGVDATRGVTAIVESMHGTIASTVLPIGAKPKDKARGLSGLVYRTIHGTTTAIGGTIDAGLELALSTLKEDDQDNTPALGWQSALNGVCGDYLESTDNSLALPMTKMEARTPLSEGAEILAIHGLCLDESSWQRANHNHPQMLAEDLDLSLSYLRYNTGLSVAANGARLDQLLEHEWQHVGIRSRLDVLAHSMGGLVIRAALSEADKNEHNWPKRIRRVVCLGTPHRGSPLEKAGNIVDKILEFSPYSAPIARLGKVRSAGIQDMRHGRLDEESSDRKFVGHFYLVAGCRKSISSEKQASNPGDGLVAVASALAFVGEEAVQTERTMLVPDTGHFELLESDAVFKQLKAWLA